MVETVEFGESGVTLTLYGLITSTEIYNTNKTIIEHPSFDSMRYQLWIFHSVVDFKISTGQIRKIAQQDEIASKKNPHIQVAIVSDSPLVFGVGRMYQAFSGENPWEIKVFYQLDEARDWLESSSIQTAESV